MSDLIRVAKDGDHLSVHPSCLAAHQRAGWVVAEAEVAVLTDREINADLEAMGVEPDPRESTEARMAQHDASRASRKV